MEWIARYRFFFAAAAVAAIAATTLEIALDDCVYCMVWLGWFPNWIAEGYGRFGGRLPSRRHPARFRGCGPSG